MKFLRFSFLMIGLCALSFFMEVKGQQHGAVLVSSNTQSMTCWGGGLAGSYNNTYGFRAGRIATGDYNSFFGNQAGQKTTTGSYNTFMGASAGLANTTGIYNSFFGEGAGFNNTIGGANTFLGRHAGHKNNDGQKNVFVGDGAGLDNTKGSNNVYLGRLSGHYNQGSNNLYLGSGAGGKVTNESNALRIANNSSKTLILGDFANNKVGIGIHDLSAVDATLAVNGNIHARGLTLDLNFPAPDYVFAKEYKLRSLQEVDAYIQKHHHLPTVPSAKTMEKEGVKVLEMSMKLLEKVEELTLYTIAQQKEIAKLKAQVKQLQQKK